MLYTEYRTLSTGELLRLVFNNPDVDKLTLELAIRLDLDQEHIADVDAEIHMIKDDVSRIEDIVSSLGERVAKYA